MNFFLYNIINFLDGHYVAYCKNEFDKNWYEFDDSVVTRIDTLEVLDKEAYVLFYQKKISNATNDCRKKCKKLFCKFIKEVFFLFF